MKTVTVKTVSGFTYKTQMDVTDGKSIINILNASLGFMRIVNHNIEVIIPINQIDHLEVW